MKADPQQGRATQEIDARNLKASIDKADLALIFRILLTRYSKTQLEIALSTATR